jgi:N-acyl-D-amino-acid deacylase
MIMQHERRSAILFATLLGACASTPSEKAIDEAASTPRPAHYQTIIRGAQVFDGSGAAAVITDVAIQDQKIVSVGDLSKALADTNVDAKGKFLTPGFINVLSWAPESLLLDGRGLSDIHQGVTLEIFGEGWSEGPLNETMKTDALRNMQEEFKHPIDWTSLDEFLSGLQRRGIAPNVASFVGAATVRIHELGEVDRAPTATELARMEALVDQAMRDGALGLGSALIYAPGTYAKTDELIALAKVASRHGGSYISHMRSEGNKFLESLDELIRIAREANIHAEVYHLKAAGQSNWPKMAGAIARIERARAEGLNVSANMYAYVAGATGLDAAMPTWVQEGGYEAWRKRLLDPKIRARVLREMRTPSDAWENLRMAAGSADNVLLLGFKNPALRQYTGKTLAAVSTSRGKSPEETVIDLVIEDGSRVETAYFLMSEDNVRLGLKQPWVSLGSDAEALAPEGVFLLRNPHPRTYGNFVRFLQRYVRDEKLLSWPEAIHRLSGLPAQNFKLKNRGCIAVGCYADLALFDPAQLQENSTFEKPHALASGMDSVWVNGLAVLLAGKDTDAKPGQVVRGPGYQEPVLAH